MSPLLRPGRRADRRRLPRTLVGLTLVCLLTMVAPTASARTYGDPIADVPLDAADVELTEGPALGAPGPQTTTACYGNAWSGDWLSNYRTGFDNWGWSFRWRAPRNATLSGLRVYWADNSAGDPMQGYATGNGGSIAVSVRDDEGSGFPNMAGPALATHLKVFPTMQQGTIDPRTTQDKREHLFGLMELSNPVPVVAGRLYHVTFENIDPNPEANHASVNVLLAPNGERSACMPDARSWGLTYFSAADPAQRSDYSDHQGAALPIMELSFADGSSYGNGFIEGWVDARRPVEGLHRVRQVFEPQEELSVSAVGVRLFGTGTTGTVAVELKDSSSVLARAEIAAGRFSGGHGTWVEVPMQHELAAGETYTLELSARDGANVLAQPLLDGSSWWGFSKQTTWSRGFAQSSVDGGASWVGWHGDGQSDLRLMQGDLQLYLRLAT